MLKYLQVFYKNYEENSDKLSQNGENTVVDSEQVSTQVENGESLFEFKPNLSHSSIMTSSLTNDDFSKKAKLKQDKVWNCKNKSQILYYSFQQHKQWFSSFYIHRTCQNLQKNITKYFSQQFKNYTTFLITTSLRQLYYQFSYLQLENYDNMFIGQYTNEQFQLPLSAHVSKYPFRKFKRENIIRFDNIRRIKTSFFQRRILYFSQQLSKQLMGQYCLFMTQGLTSQELLKVSYIFPTSVSISDISWIISRRLREHVCNKKLGDVIDLLSFKITFVGSGLRSVVIINHQTFTQKILPNYFSLAIGCYMGSETAHKSFENYVGLLNNMIEWKLPKYVGFKKDLDLARGDRHQLFSTFNEAKWFNSPTKIRYFSLDEDTLSQYQFYQYSYRQATIITKRSLQKAMLCLFSDHSSNYHYISSDSSDDEYYHVPTNHSKYKLAFKNKNKRQYKTKSQLKQKDSNMHFQVKLNKFQLEEEEDYFNQQ